MHVRPTVLLFAAFTSPFAHAQSPQTAPTVATLSFDVISVKQDKLAQGWSGSTTPDGYKAKGITLKYLLTGAYDIRPDYRIIGAPAWWDDIRYDVEAKVADSDIPALKALTWPQRGAMVQQILTDRFKLKVHREVRTEPIYSLVVAKPGMLVEQPPSVDSKTIPMGMMPGRGDRKGQMVVSTFNTTFLASNLSGMMGRMVIDDTGLTGVYHADLHWTPESTLIAAGQADADSNTLSVFTALPEQVGLRLIPSKGPVEVLVVDHVELPTGN